MFKRFFRNVSPEIFSIYGFQGEIIRRYQNVKSSAWVSHYKKRIYDPEGRNVKESDSPVSNCTEKKTNMTTKQRDAKVVRELLKGKTLREIGASLGIDSKAVYRIGAKQNTFSVRSKRYS